jgi:hypothetical protein
MAFKNLAHTLNLHLAYIIWFSLIFTELQLFKDIIWLFKYKKMG